MIARWNYDSDDRATSSVSRDGKNVTIDYTDPDAVAVTDAHGNERIYDIAEFAGRKKVTHVTGGSGCVSCGNDVIRYDYDEFRNLTEKEYSNGRIDQFFNYDDKGRAGTVIRAVGTDEEKTITTTWHPNLSARLSLTQTSLLGTGTRETVWDYDNDGNDTPNENPTLYVYRKIDRGYTLDETGAVIHYEYITSYDYNTRGQVTFVDGPLSGDQDKTIFEYDPVSGDLLFVTKPLVGTSALTYDAAGNLKTTIDINGVESVYTYDGKNRSHTVTQNGITRFNRTYTPAGELEFVTDAGQRTTRYTYDEQYGRKETVTDMAGNYQKFGYDDLGHITDTAFYDQDDTLNRIVKFDYDGPDNSGKLWKQINFDESFTEYRYNDSGNLENVIPPDEKTVTYTYDIMNRVKDEIRPGQVITSYTYDDDGHVTSVTDAAQHTTHYIYDDLGRRVEVRSPDTGTTRYSYTALGKIRSKTTHSGKTTIYGYDALGRVTGIIYEDTSENVSFFYDEGEYAMGKLSGKTGPGYSYTYTYYPEGQISSVIKTIDGMTFTTGYSYDDAGILTGMTYPDERTITYGLDVNGQYVSVSITRSGITNTLAQTAAYKPFGPLKGLTFGNNLELSRSFDQGYNLTGITLGTVQDLTYVPDPTGKISDIIDKLDSTRSQTFKYDDLNRLEKATGIYGNLSYTYDDAGNRETRTENNQTDIYAYVPGTNIIDSVSGLLNTSFAHDDDGNVLNMSTETLGPVASSGSSYLYNPDGQRLRKTTNGVSTYYHYDLNGNLIAETDATGTVITSYIYMGGMRIARVAADAGICYYHDNHLQTPVAMTDQSGTVVWKADYKPFGEALVDPASTVVNDFRFPGQYYDSETGLHYNWNRYYDPGTGRYLTPDPIGLDGGDFNPFSYVGSDPLNKIDINGLSKKDFAEKLYDLWSGFDNLNSGISICSCTKFISLAKRANSLCRKERELYVLQYGSLQGDIRYMAKYNEGYPSDAYLSCTGEKLKKVIGNETLKKYYYDCFDAVMSLITLPL